MHSTNKSITYSVLRSEPSVSVFFRDILKKKIAQVESDSYVEMYPYLVDLVEILL